MSVPVCCLSQVNLTCTPVLPPGKINTFITKEVVPELYQQRNSADGQQQFAVLFLGNKDDDEYKLSKFIIQYLGVNYNLIDVIVCGKHA